MSAQTSQLLSDVSELQADSYCTEFTVREQKQSYPKSVWKKELEAKSKNRILVLTLQLRRVFSGDLKTVGEAEVLIQRARISRVCSCESCNSQ